MPKYTFLLPAYKARFLEKSLESILNQTYSDFNVIVSDDCSPEDLKSIVEKFDDPRMVYRRNESNYGLERLVNHWNLLLGMAHSEYIIMASDDDVYAPEYLEKINYLSNRYPSANVIRPLISHINQNDDTIKTEKPLGKDYVSLEEYIDRFLGFELFSGLQQFVFKTTALTETGGFVKFPAAWYSDDATVFKLGNNGIAIADEVLFSMRLSGISISSNVYSRKTTWCKFKASVSYVRYLKRQCTSLISDRQIELIILRTKRQDYDILMKVDITTFLFCMMYAMISLPLVFTVRWGVICFKSYFLGQNH